MSQMKTQLLFLSTLLLSLSINAQIDFEAHIIADSHPDIIGPYALASADIDGDGDKDIVATSTNGDKVVWFENLDGQGNFSEPKIIISNMDYPLDIAVADIDGDGDLDIIAVSTFDNKIVWFENLDGLGTFGPQNLIATLNYVQTVQAKDMDGDGDIDIIAGGDNKVIWLENLDGLGTFGPEKIVTDGIITTESIEVVDIDGDGDMDVVVADWMGDKVAWYENIDGQGTFGPERIITNEAFGPTSVVLKDMDNDGYLDVVSIYEEDSIAWFKNTDGLGNFSAPNIIASNIGFAYKLFAEDLDGDGNMDIIASLFDNKELVWLKNDGSGNFGTPQVIHSDGFTPIGVIADDFNSDGKMDVAACFRGPDKIIWFENKGALGVEENTTNLFTLFPNPTNAELNINSIAPISEIIIYNNLGQLLLNADNTNQLDVSVLSKGIYIVNIKDENGGSETKKFIRN